MKPRKGAKVPVSERALIQRINRKLKDDDEVLKKSRSSVHPETGEVLYHHEIGQFYIIDVRSGLTAKHIDLEGYGRELGVLREWEQLSQE